MIKLIESQTVEFKQIWKDEYLKTICALANTDGGAFYIRICDNKELIGVNNSFVESWGKGTNNMIDDCLKMDLPEPEYRYTFASVQVIFYKTPQKTPQKSTRENILMLMKQDSKVTIAIISQELNIGRDTINEHISKLKKESKIKRIGGRKDGYWKVLDE